MQTVIDAATTATRRAAAAAVQDYAHSYNGEAPAAKPRKRKYNGKAKAAFEQALKVAPEDARARAGLGWHATEYLADYAAAARYYREALERGAIANPDEKRRVRHYWLRDPDRAPHGRRVRVAGVVLSRQRPSTAKGIVFMTIEDETGIANLIIRPEIYRRYRRVARHGVAIVARGRVERAGEVVHVRPRPLRSTR